MVQLGAAASARDPNNAMPTALATAAPSKAHDTSDAARNQPLFIVTPRLLQKISPDLLIRLNPIAHYVCVRPAAAIEQVPLTGSDCFVIRMHNTSRIPMASGIQARTTNEPSPE